MKASLSNALKVATYPSATHSLPWLRAKKVVARMSNELNAKHKDQYGNLFFKFTLLASGDWQVIVQHISTRDTHVLFAFEISRQKVEMMQYAGKLTKEPFPPDTEFVVMNCFCLLQLLGRIRSSEWTLWAICCLECATCHQHGWHHVVHTVWSKLGRWSSSSLGCELSQTFGTAWTNIMFTARHSLEKEACCMHCIVRIWLRRLAEIHTATSIHHGHRRASVPV